MGEILDASEACEMHNSEDCLLFTHPDVLSECLYCGARFCMHCNCPCPVPAEPE